MMNRWVASILLALGLANVPQAVRAEQATMLAAGSQHACAVTTAGGVLCWGYNSQGQLGNGSVTNSNVPVVVNNLGSGVAKVASGYEHSCAVLNNGTVQCWGMNNSGQLGDGTTTSRNTPVAVTGLTGVVAIGVGWTHSCAVLATGKVKCWGYNLYGQLGNGLTGPSSIPVDVAGVNGATSLALGYGHTCALINSGKVQCWGNNGSGQLGNGTVTASTTRVDVSGLSDAAAITAGHDHSCVKTATGAAKCWGINSSGQLGNGTTLKATAPIAVSNLSDVAQINSSAVANSTCAVMTSGVAQCWGDNANGQLGNGDKVNKLVPTAVNGLAGSASAIIVGKDYGCARVNDGVQCWGRNVFGQYGAGNFTTFPFPQNTVGLFGSAPPLTPAALSPVTSSTPVYTWKAVPGSTSYNLRINGVTTSYSAAQTNCPDGVGLCTLQGTALTPGAYSWQVQPFNSYGNGNWSALLSFTL